MWLVAGVAPAEMPFAGWSNLSALGCLIALVLWFATRGLPSIMEKWATATELARADFKETNGNLIEEVSRQRQDFREESELLRVEFREESAAQRVAFEATLGKQREQSRELALSGHDVVRKLTSEIKQLRQVCPAGTKLGGE